MGQAEGEVYEAEGTDQIMTSKPKSIIFTIDQVNATLEGRRTQHREPVKPMRGYQSTWLTPELINLVPHGEIAENGWQMHHPEAGTRYAGVDVAHDSPLGWVKCPFGPVGGLIRVRETWAASIMDPECEMDARTGDNCTAVYKATDSGNDWTHDQVNADGTLTSTPIKAPWRSAATMPEWASRLTLQIDSIQVARLQSITEADCIAEGIQIPVNPATDRPLLRLTGKHPPSAYLSKDATSEAWFRAFFASTWDAKHFKVSPWVSDPWVWVMGYHMVKDQS